METANSSEPASAAGQKRRKAMTEAAYALFVEKGFSSVTVDDIIRISGGSKSSFYGFFGSKEGVLKAVIESLAEEILRELRMEIPEDRPPRESLQRIGMQVGKLALSENAINQYRLAVANARTFPELSRLWYESGPKTTFDGFAEYLRRQNEAGRLRVKNPARAALFFLGMVIFKDNMTRSIGAPPPSQGELQAIVEEAVDVFLAAYGTDRN